MKSFINKLSLLALCSTFFIQINAAEDYRKIMTNLNTIQQSAQTIHNNAGKYHKVRIKAAQDANAALAQLPQDIQNNLKPLFNKVKENGRKANVPADTDALNSAINIEMAKANDALNKEKAVQNSTWMGYMGSKASQMFSGAKAMPGRAYGAALGIGSAATTPLTWTVGKLLDETDKVKLDAAELQLEEIDSKIANIMQQIEEAKTTYKNNPAKLKLFLQVAHDSLNKLNTQAQEPRITLGLIGGFAKKLLYYGSALMISAVLGYFVDKYTDGQIDKALTSTGKSAQSKLRDVYQLVTTSSLQDFKNYMTAKGKGLTEGVTGQYQNLQNWWNAPKKVTTENTPGVMERMQKEARSWWEGTRKPLTTGLTQIDEKSDPMNLSRI